ncbi:MAG: hypothetical protein ABSA32_05440 [Candidatus Acidiferrales bacterium]|jgi:hypothetical protein
MIERSATISILLTTPVGFTDLPDRGQLSAAAGSFTMSATY